jgi:hypothetical protein
VLLDVNGDHEDPRDYRRGGYHPVRLGELFNRRSVSSIIYGIELIN